MKTRLNDSTMQGNIGSWVQQRWQQVPWTNETIFQKISRREKVKHGGGSETVCVDIYANGVRDFLSGEKHRQKLIHRHAVQSGQSP